MIGWHQRFFIGIKDAVGFRPFIDGYIHGIDICTQNPSCTCIQVQYAVCCIGEDDAVIDIFKDGFHEVGLIAQFADCLFQLGFRLFVFADVSENDYTASYPTFIGLQGSAADTDISAL